MGEAKTVSVKYIFMDVVSFSQNRSVEAQTDIIEKLNELVRDTAKVVGAPGDQTIYLPTGDGICIALLGVESPFDIHMQLALTLLERLDIYNSQTHDEMRRFQIRIGINANVDNLVIDINQKENVAGSGINLAQRIMDSADGNHILVGNAVFETLRQRQKYMKSFRSFTSQGKHGVTFPVHQFVEPHPGVNTSVPSLFVPKQREDPRLTKFAAYYFAHAIKNRDVLKRLAINGWGVGSYAAKLLLTRLAQDSVGNSEATEINPYNPYTWKAGEATLDEQYEHYKEIGFSELRDLSAYIDSKDLTGYIKYFDRGAWGFNFHFVTAEGREKLKNEVPKVWNEFGFDTLDELQQ